MGIGNMAYSVEEPSYKVVGKIGKVEIRHYQAVVQARTVLSDSTQTTAGFRRLAGFIFGGNDAGQKISMTAPVQETLGEHQPELAFTMPQGYSLDNLPSPNDPSVSLTEIPARTVAVIRFSGWATAGKIRRYQQQLLASIESRNIEAVNAPMLNQYNPPWTPPFLRRNEIMLEIDATPVRSLAGFTATLYDTPTYSF
jgi:effector-binding domain-containing protein